MQVAMVKARHTGLSVFSADLQSKVHISKDSLNPVLDPHSVFEKSLSVLFLPHLLSSLNCTWQCLVSWVFIPFFKK